MEKKKKKNNVGMGRLLKLNVREIPWILLGAIFAGGMGAMNPIFSIIFSELVGVYFQPPDKMKTEVIKWSLLFLAIGGASLIFHTLQSGLFSIAGEALTKKLRKLAFQSLLYQDMAFYDKQENSPSFLAGKLATEATLVEGIVGPRLGVMATALVAIGTGLGIAFSSGWKLTLVVLATSPFIVLSNMIQMAAMKRLAQSSEKKNSEGNRIAVESISSIKTVASFSAENMRLREYVSTLLEPRDQAIRKAHISGFLLGFGQFSLFAAYTLSFWYGGILIQQGEMNFTQVLKVFMAVVMSAFAVGQTSALAPNAGKAQQAAEEIFSIIDRKPGIDSSDPGQEKLLAPDSDKFRGEIEFKNITFRYPNRPEWIVLKNFNLKVKPGQKVALVGESGSGKSTVVSLLLRHYDPEQGEILLDGKNIREYKISWLRSQLGLVGQEPVLFSGSIGENIAYGKPRFLPPATGEEIQQAAKKSNAHRFVSVFANSYNTSVGERGVQLSGGQKQRVAIARAVIRNPKILLLDEATSALDSRSERKVQHALEKVMEDKTTIVIAHRLSTIRDADNICVVKKGKVAEMGTHAELMEMGGVYAGLVNRQTH